MSIAKELLDTVRDLGALEKRTEDVLRQVESVNSKLDNLLERITKLEADFRNLKENVRNDIMAELKADLAKTKLLLDLHQQGLLPQRGTSV